MNKLVSEFYMIRNIPYHISTNGEPGFDCEDKAKMLSQSAESLGVEPRLRVGIFRWSSLNLPEKILKISHDEACSHIFVELKNTNGEWIFADPTWNPELQRAGFVIPEWDGESHTDLAMDLDNIFSPAESDIYLKNIDYVSDLARNKDFYDAINSYCDSFL